ncbi:MAG: SDR family oxidoreductase [Oscillospiraceae bacterium]|jgi:NAD(P)-dependent dehydrogenase (short-subunit alcohol dehydrogenase family)|nr:SDR family oxidoreductase [Oscillospiraceae bacterium]
MNSPYGNRILITGASSGIGLAAAEAFAKEGYTVWAASRRCEERREGNCRYIRMDVTSEDSVRRAYDKIAEAGGVAILLHCAGMGIAGAAEDTPEEAVRRQFEVNYYGVLRVNRIFLPDLRARGGGLVLVMSSVAGRVPLPYQSHYSATKYALDTYVESLRMEAGRFGIRAALIEPGDTKTGFTAAREMALPEGSPYRAACEGAVARMSKDEQNGGSPLAVAKICLKLAQKKHPPVRVTVGLMYRIVIFLRRIWPAGAFEKVLEGMYR